MILTRVRMIYARYLFVGDARLHGCKHHLHARQHRALPFDTRACRLGDRLRQSIGEGNFAANIGAIGFGPMLPRRMTVWHRPRDCAHVPAVA
jgi:hypothetical protein